MGGHVDKLAVARVNLLMAVEVRQDTSPRLPGSPDKLVNRLSVIDPYRKGRM